MVTPCEQTAASLLDTHLYASLSSKPEGFFSLFYPQSWSAVHRRQAWVAEQRECVCLQVERKGIANIRISLRESSGRVGGKVGWSVPCSTGGRVPKEGMSTLYPVCSL